MSPTMLSIDPGTRTCGVAWWRDSQLCGATVATNPLKVSEAGPRECAAIALEIKRWWSLEWLDPRVLALEVPQIYQRAAGKSKGDPNKVMPIYGVAAALAALFPFAEVRFGTPHDWKGGIKKPKNVREPYAIHERVVARLSAIESSRVVWPTSIKQSWDVDDAIGIGLHHLGRFERARVFARE